MSLNFGLVLGTFRLSRALRAFVRHFSVLRDHTRKFEEEMHPKKSRQESVR
jgi:hypothetical protein